MEKILETTSSLLFVFRNKTTGEYVDEAKKNLDTFDEPEEWYIVKKIIVMSIIGEPIEIKQFI